MIPYLNELLFASVVCVNQLSCTFRVGSTNTTTNILSAQLAFCMFLIRMWLKFAVPSSPIDLHEFMAKMHTRSNITSTQNMRALGTITTSRPHRIPLNGELCGLCCMSTAHVGSTSALTYKNSTLYGYNTITLQFMWDLAGVSIARLETTPRLNCI